MTFWRKCIDQNGSSPRTNSSLVHHVIVRADVKFGVQAANLVHAAGESSDRIPPGTIAVALHARDELHLRVIQARLFEADIPHTSIVEEDGEYTGQLMAVGLEPTTNRERVRKILSSLPLVR